MANSKKKKKNRVGKINYKHIGLVLLIIIVFYVLIYLCFKGEGFIPAGSNLTGIIRCQTPSTTIYILAP